MWTPALLTQLRVNQSRPWYQNVWLWAGLYAAIWIGINALLVYPQSAYGHGETEAGCGGHTSMFARATNADGRHPVLA